MISQWQSFLLRNTGPWGLPEGERWRALFHNNYHPHCSNINLFWFCKDEKFPRVVTKLYRDRDLIQQEYVNLLAVHASAPNHVPRPLHFEFQNEFWALWMQGVSGARLQTADMTQPCVLSSICDVVTGIHAVLRNTTPSEDRYRRTVSDPLDAVEAFGDSTIVRRGCDSLRQAVEAAWLNALPRIPQHGDLYTGNMLWTGTTCYLIDWETFGVIDLPLYDLITFFISLIGDDPKAPWKWSPSLARNVCGHVTRYCRRLGVSPADVSLLLPLSLCNWFHLHWSTGRQQFSESMYRTLEDCFGNSRLWVQRMVDPQTS